MKPIPLLFKTDGRWVIDMPSSLLAKDVLEGAPGWTPRRELTAKASFLLDAERRWFQYRLLKATDKRPNLFVETHSSKNNVRGWVPAEQGWAYSALKAALKAKDPAEKLSPGVYVLVEGEDDGDALTLMRPADAEVCAPLAGHPLNYKMLKSFFIESMPNLGWQGVVWWGPNGETLRLGVSDFR